MKRKNTLFIYSGSYANTYLLVEYLCVYKCLCMYKRSCVAASVVRQTRSLKAAPLRLPQGELRSVLPDLAVDALVKVMCFRLGITAITKRFLRVRFCLRRLLELAEILFRFMLLTALTRPCVSLLFRNLGQTSVTRCICLMGS